MTDRPSSDVAFTDSVKAMQERRVRANSIVEWRKEAVGRQP
jgi:hypothetical protein